jgi:hypothetical protein
MIYSPATSVVLFVVYLGLIVVAVTLQDLTTLGVRLLRRGLSVPRFAQWLVQLRAADLRGGLAQWAHRRVLPAIHIRHAICLIASLTQALPGVGWTIG